MNDRELLELAAKAAGYWLRSERDADFQSDKVWISTQSLDGVRYWPEWKVFDPLTDDGDALRLAVDAQVSIAFSYCDDGVPVVAAGDFFNQVRECLAPDFKAKTRRAIVRAAAEIGKAMK